MVYESSYESGRRPFTPDTKRGYWADPNDFISVCMGLGFKLDFFFVPMTFFIRMGISAFIPYLICIALYVVPIMVMQSFMGQFSSSGFLSAFRVSPIFKGMGYISVAVNFALLTYYSAFTTVPLLFFFNSLRPTLPWSCEAFRQKTDWNATDEERATICNLTDTEIVNSNNTANDSRIFYELPSVIFFKEHFSDFSYVESSISFSWELFGCTIVTWGIVAGIFYKFYNTAELGKLLRYAIWGTLSVLLLCIMRFMFLPGAVNSLSHYIAPGVEDMLQGVSNVLVYSMMAFGPGWGSIITLSSFNKFNTNIMRDSWIISIGQMLIFMAFNISAMLVDWHFTTITDQSYFNFVENHWDLYFSTASAIAHMSFANFWSLLFYGMLTVAALIVIVTQIHILLTTIFDEFEYLRAYKLKVTFILIGVLAFFSLYLCTNEGIMYFSVLSVDTLFTQAALNLLLLLIVLWIYGRERFQRDIEFMLNQPFATWKVNMLRFVAPLCLLLILFFAIINSIFEHMYTTVMFHILAAFLILAPWLSIPGYGLYIILQTTGPWLTRIKRSCRPTDWYPVEPENRQRYEVAMGNENITHQLNELGEEVL